MTGRAAVPSALPVDAVVLSLLTSDGASFHLATVHPDDNASFTATFDLPGAASTGRANITDNRGRLIELVIAEA